MNDYDDDDDALPIILLMEQEDRELFGDEFEGPPAGEPSAGIVELLAVLVIFAVVAWVFRGCL